MKTIEIIRLIMHFYNRESYIPEGYYKGLIDGFLISVGLADIIGNIEEIEKVIKLWKAMEALIDE